MNRGKYILVTVGALALLVLSACSVSGTSANASVPTPVPTPKPAKALLQSSSTVMQNLTSEHTLQTMSIGGQAVIAFSPELASASVDPSKLSLSLKLEGDQSRTPDQSSMTVEENAAVGATQIAVNNKEVTKDGKTYIQNSKGNWFVLDENTAKNDSSNPFGSGTTSKDYADAFQSAEEGTIVDHGVVTLNGMGLRHITSTLDSSGIQRILASTNGGATADASKFQSATIDFWIDNATSYTYRITESLSVAPVSTATPDNSAVVQIDLSNFNKSFTVTVPANATPATSYQQIEQQ